MKVNAKDLKPAGVVFYEDMVLFECPFCGRTLIRSNYEKVQRLIDEEDGPPRGKICPKCDKAVMLKLDDEAKQIVSNRNPR